MILYLGVNISFFASLKQEMLFKAWWLQCLDHICWGDLDVVCNPPLPPKVTVKLVCTCITDTIKSQLYDNYHNVMFVGVSRLRFYLISVKANHSLLCSMGKKIKYR